MQSGLGLMHIQSIPVAFVDPRLMQPGLIQPGGVLIIVATTIIIAIITTTTSTAVIVIIIIIIVITTAIIRITIIISTTIVTTMSAGHSDASAGHSIVSVRQYAVPVGPIDGNNENAYADEDIDFRKFS